MDRKGTFSVSQLVDKIAIIGRQKKFGWKALDRREIGAGPGDLVIMAGRTGHGKSAALFNLLLHWLDAYPDQSFVFYSYEIPVESVLVRLLSILTRWRGAVGWTYGEVLRCLQGGDERVPEGVEAGELEVAVQTLQSWESRLQVLYEPEWRIDELIRYSHEMRSRIDNLGGIFVDYLQLVEPPASESYDGREDEVAVVARMLKRMSINLHCPVITAAQIRTDSVPKWHQLPNGPLDSHAVMEAIAKRRPQLSHMGHGGGEQEADVVLGLLNYQADYFAGREEAGMTQESMRETGTAAPFEVGVIKNRHGQLGSALLILEAASGCIRDTGVLGR